MKICFAGFDLPEGKVKFQDEKVITLENKFAPQKTTPFYAEFIKDDFQNGDAIFIARDRILDLLILDMEKLETRWERTADAQEKKLLDKCLEYLEQEMPLCQAQFNDEEMALLRGLAPLSLKPTVVAARQPEVNEIIKAVLAAAGIVFFYTAGKKEVHAWPVAEGADIVSCAGKIHSDLARGFIKADIVSYHDLMGVHNLQEARSKGLVKLVDRDYSIRPGDIVEIRFNI
jgi:ribosome-binding ATPase YchF (GTP1/OBG family)